VIASITAKGRIQLSLYEPIPPPHGGAEGVGATEPGQIPSADSPSPSAAEAVSPPITPSPSFHAPLTSASSEPGTALPNGAVDEFQVVLLIHGIRTQADWGPMVKSKIEVPGQIQVIPIKYGYFDAFRFWFPFWTRSKPVERVYVQIRVALQKYRKEHPDAKLSIIAHSFGTYVVGQILKREFDLKIHRLIPCGSVLPQDFPWHQYQGRFDNDKVVNECGKSDIWPVLAQSTSWGYGATGTHGFGAVLVKDRFHAGGHGQYFEPEFVERYWEPFIRRGEYQGTEFEKTMPPTPWWISVLGILPLRYGEILLLSAVLVIALDSGINALRPSPGVPDPSMIAWRQSLDPVPIREMHLRCEFRDPLEKTNFNNANTLAISYTLFRSHQSELFLNVIPRFFVHPVGVPYSPEDVGTLLVGQSGSVAQNVPITESDITPLFEDKDRKPYILYVTFPIDEVKKRHSNKSDAADWPITSVGQLRLTESTVEVRGALSDQVRSVSIMMNREIILEIPLSKQAGGGFVGNIDDNSSILRKRRKASFRHHQVASPGGPPS
jgi:hypothetical protein